MRWIHIFQDKIYLIFFAYHIIIMLVFNILHALRKRSTYIAPLERITRRLEGGFGKRIWKVAF